MDYILQIEKLISYLKFNFGFEKSLKIDILKHKFSKDLNLIGCFIKDYLILKTNEFNIADDKLYEKFVLYFENNINSKKNFLDELNEYSTYYLMIVFENIENVEILSAVSTINSCFALEAYPLIMEILYKYFNNIIEDKVAIKMLKSLVNVVLANFENEDNNKISLYNIKLGEDKLIIDEFERLERSTACGSVY